MGTTNELIPELVDEAGGLALELLRRLDLLAGANVHDDISYAKYKVLRAVQKTDRIAIGNLGRAVGSATSTTSEIVTRLAKAGLVAKTRNVYDGRAVVVELTDRGRQVVERYRRRIHEGYVSLFSGLSLVERETFLGAMKQLDALLREVDDAREAATRARARRCTSLANGCRSSRWVGSSGGWSMVGETAADDATRAGLSAEE